MNLNDIIYKSDKHHDKHNDKHNNDKCKKDKKDKKDKKKKCEDKCPEVKAFDLGRLGETICEKTDPCNPCEKKLTVCREVICACPPIKVPRPQCNSDLVETNEITLVEAIVPPTSSTFPHTLYPRIENNHREKKCPQAPIYLTASQGPLISALGRTLSVKATAVDTHCKAEIALETLPAGFNELPIVNYASDIAFLGVTGILTITVNTTPYNIGPGDSIYVKSGSNYSLANNTGTAINYFVVNIGPGTLGYFNDVGIYQTAVGGVDNLDPCEVQVIGDRYSIYPAPGNGFCSSGCTSIQLPGTIRLLPMPGIGECCNGSWGLICNQLLSITQATAPSVPALKPYASIRPQDCESTLIYTANNVSVTVVATVLRDPEAGRPEAVATPNINGGLTSTLITGQSYYVYYDGCRNDVIIVNVNNFTGFPL